MKRAAAPLLILIAVGAFGCKEPVYYGAKSSPESAPAETESPAAESAVISPAELAGLSPRQRVLAIRAGLIGKVFPELEINGTTLGEVTIVSITDVGVRLRLDAGATDLAWEDLPADLREKWGHDPAVNPISQRTSAELASEDGENEEATAAPAPEPQELDTRGKTQLLALRTQITRLNENLRNARKTVEEAEAFHVELSMIYEAEEKKAAAEKAARVYERMRSSSCSS